MDDLYFSIQTPKDLKALPQEKLSGLADSLRQDIIHHTSVNGGHIGASLSCVDLIVGMHRVFDTPCDSFVFDVGHQAYAHKMLTGRRHQFNKIRKEGGPSGFTNRFESDHDAFGAGHASTSISAAMGILEGKKRTGNKTHVVAMIGDGALTGGLSFEGLNTTGELARNLIIIFNDNGISIDPNVGALKDSFNLCHTNAEKYFQILGIDYWGPFDGHNLDEIIATLGRAKLYNHPLVLHFKTQKGYGYSPALGDQTRFHGCGPFKVECGTAITDAIPLSKYQDIFAEALIKMAERDNKIVAITAAMPSGTSLKKFGQAHPDRLYDVGIAEAHAALFGAGLATQGIKPFVCIYSTFLQRAYDQLIHDIGIQNLPVRVVMDRGGLVGDDGATHQGVFDFAYLMCLPGFVVMAPKDEVELVHMLETMRRHDTGPITVRYPRGDSFGQKLPKHPHPIPIGKAELLYGDSKGDLLMLAIGQPVQDCMKAARQLEAQEKLNVTVVNLRFAKPLDAALISALAPHFKALVTVEEGAVQGGVGSAVLQTLCENIILKPVKILGIPDRYIEHASQAKQRQICGIDVKSIFNAALDILEKSDEIERDSLLKEQKEILKEAKLKMA